LTARDGRIEAGGRRTAPGEHAKERAMAITMNPYLGFKDNAREAMEFYHSVFGGDLATSTFKQFGASTEPAEDDLVMHSQLTTPTGLTLMASDTPDRMPFTPGDNFSVSLSGAAEDGDRLREYWSRLCEGAQVTMPLETAIWGDAFGMLRDRFGVSWLVNIAGQGGDQQDGQPQA
jgi:PhnB protein